MGWAALAMEVMETAARTPSGIAAGDATVATAMETVLQLMQALKLAWMTSRWI